MSMRARILRALFRISYSFRIPMLSDVFQKGRVKILMYHGIPTSEHFKGVTNFNGYNIPEREFEQHLIYLKRHCNVISLSDMLAECNWSKTKTNIVLTFDDGYENNYSNAFRLLTRYELPATFALTTAFVCQREPLWNDIVEYAVTNSLKSRIRFQWDDDYYEWPLTSLAGRVQLYQWLIQKCLQVDQTRRGALLDMAVEELGVSDMPDILFQDEDYRPLTRAQIKEMVDSGLAEFASHSLHHYALPRLETKLRSREFLESKSQIEALTGMPCTNFTIPGGAYDPEILDEAFQAGYECVLTSDLGLATRGRQVLNRNAILREPGLHRFTDTVHGPISELIQAVGGFRTI